MEFSLFLLLEIWLSYADDAAVFYDSNSWYRLSELVQEDFRKIDDFVDLRVLFLNEEKTISPSFSLNSPTPLAELIRCCRLQGLKSNVKWHNSNDTTVTPVDGSPSNIPLDDGLTTLTSVFEVFEEKYRTFLAANLRIWSSLLGFIR
ncbi:hypothetical protein WA026_010526 [Henosepilachna vigintioctopunctata]|uniref:Uncharacterized protein n=1 Tax=Henosepilachna vigintioctopunctata TaxID=420089 RepID=A0AAW1V714_9CUCU